MKQYTRNEFTVKIGVSVGALVDCTAQVPFPIKLNNLLDEQLDEATIAVLRAVTPSFQPFTTVVISWSNGADSASADDTATFYVASDKANEIPPGSERYNHDVYLIEETKWLERFIIPSSGFTNALGRSYVD